MTLFKPEPYLAAYESLGEVQLEMSQPPDWDPIAPFDVDIPPDEWETAIKEAVRRTQTQRLRDIFGNPFRPVTFDPSWQTSTVVALAKQMYESRDFSPMPILADALQDAGCDHADILDHCRGPGPHVRGCWVVDLVLGKV
jgi:hypothetical protein